MEMHSDQQGDYKWQGSALEKICKDWFQEKTRGQTKLARNPLGDPTTCDDISDLACLTECLGFPGVPWSGLHKAGYKFEAFAARLIVTG